jgi:YHS domain-containing protein
MKRFTSIAFAALLTPIAAFAGPQYVDETGFAASGFDVVSYFSLEQNPVGQSQPAPVPGKKSITAEHNGATFAFSSEANRDAFISSPEKYAPQFDGHCAYGVSRGGKVPANPNLWRIVDDKLYLNITPVVVGFWEEDIPDNLDLGYTNWPGIEASAASTSTIPKYSSDAPQAN